MISVKAVNAVKEIVKVYMGGYQMCLCMPRCELCGSKADSLTTVKVSSAEMDVCSSCTDHGTVIEEEEAETDSSTKYDTESTGSEDNSSETSSSQTTPSYHDSTEEFTSLPPDYGDRIQDARESEGLSRGDLASELQEKESLIRRIENNEKQPTKELQSKLEKALQMELNSDESNAEFESEGSANNLTIGDMVEQK